MERARVLEHVQLVNAVVSSQGPLEPATVAPVIVRSWRRCYNDFGLDPADRQPPPVVDRAELQARQEQLQHLRDIAQAEMISLYQQLAGSGFSVLLTDADGVILDLLGDPSFTDSAADCGMMEGAVWSERHQGTNGMGTCAIERRPVSVHHNEHYLFRNIGLTCSAAPIFAHDGSLLAVLDASSYSHLGQQHTLVLVNMSAQMIENRFFLYQFGDQFALRFHSRPEFIGTLWEGLLALAEDGRIIAANRSALFQLGLKEPRDVAGRNVEELFDVSVNTLLGRRSQAWLSPLPLYEAGKGKRFFGLLRLPERRFTAAPVFGRRSSAPEGDTNARKGIELSQLEFGDSTMQYNIRCARRILGKDIPVLLTGETGAGKEWFALAIHAEGLGPDKPFVAVNCAAIPESLIESELFGYKPGAFTGAVREGRRGKIVQANGGTLFLDEIGDMPLPLQARLLRVLETREVVPLGGETPVRVDIRVISATHRNLKEMVAAGRFREDLYYRLAGLVLHLPPLRERQDKLALIRHLLRLECGGELEGVQVSEAALRCLETYSWPGNIRQLRNVLRTCLALCDRKVIDVADLPHEIRGEERLTGIGSSARNPEKTAMTALEQAERDAIRAQLERCRWNVTLAARGLGISRNTLYRKMRQLGIRGRTET